MKTMTFVAIDGCLFSSINNLIDAFSIANLWHRALDDTAGSPLFATQIVSVDGGCVRASGNIHIQPDRAMADSDAMDMIFLPAFCEMGHLAAPGIDAVIDWLLDHYRQGTPIATTCTGTFLLAETGLLNGRAATTNWQFARMFQHRYPEVHLKTDRIMTEDGGLICAGASTAIFNLALYLIERFGGKALATVCAKAFLVDPNRESQAPYVIFRSRKDHGDEKVLAAQQWMEANYARNISIDAMAQQVGISPRHFKRRFRKATGATPLVYLQNVRLEAAKEKLETTQESVNEITYRIGYEDSSTFRRLFKREMGLSPRAYRDKFCRITA